MGSTNAQVTKGGPEGRTSIKPRWLVNNRRGPISLVYMRISPVRDSKGNPIIEKVELRVPPGLNSYDVLELTDGRKLTEEAWARLTTQSGAKRHFSVNPETGFADLELLPSIRSIDVRRAVRLAKATASPGVLRQWTRDADSKILKRAIRDQLAAIEHKRRVARDPDAGRDEA